MALFHHEVCEAPICSGDPTPDCKKYVLWYAGEDICGKGTSKVQQNQRKINKLVTKGVFKNMDTPFTFQSLSAIGRVTVATKAPKTPPISKKEAYKHRKGQHLTPSPYQTTSHA